MPKELFNQSLEGTDFDDNDRIAVGKPNIPNAKNMLWSTFKTLINPIAGNVWGTITGTMSNQTDLQNALNLKSNLRPTTEKTSLVNADEITGNDSENSFSQIRTTWTNVKVFLKTYFDGLYQTLSNLRTSWQVTPDDTHYPSEKLTKGSLDLKANLSGADFTGIVTVKNITGYTATESAAGTTVLDVNSNIKQRLTGTATHIHQLPVTSTLTLGRVYEFVNDSTGIWTINSSGGNLVNAIAAGTTIIVMCISLSGTGAASWKVISFGGGGGSGAATSITQGTNYTEVGELLNHSFPGFTLDAAVFSGSLPTGASINNKLIIASGLSNWSRFITMIKSYLYEKEDLYFYFKAVTKNSGDAWGITQTTSLAYNNAPIFIKVDLYTGIVSFGSTSAANEYGYTSALTFSAGDNLKLTFERNPGRTTVIFENITDTSQPKAYGEFDYGKWGTSGLYKLCFLGGEQEFTNITINSRCRNYGSNDMGIVFLGDSITHGGGSTNISCRWTDVLMKGSTHLFENIGLDGWMAKDVSTTKVAEWLTGINSKYLIINFGFNDWANDQTHIDVATYTTKMQDIATTAQGLGYTVIFVSPFFADTIYNTAMGTAATNTGCKFINIMSTWILSSVVNPLYYYDGVHPNDAGHLLISKQILLNAPELVTDNLVDLYNSDIKFNDLPFSNKTIPIVGIDEHGRIFKLDSSNYKNRNHPTLKPYIYRYDIGSIAISGDIAVKGKILNLTDGQGLRLGFHNGVNDTTGSNIMICNNGVGGTGFPQAFPNITGLRNYYLMAWSAKGSGGSPTISGNDNIIINSLIPNPYAANNSTLINCQTAIGTGSGNVLIGRQAGLTLTTGGGVIWIHNSNNAGGVTTIGNADNFLILGEIPQAGEKTIAEGDMILGMKYNVSHNFYFGGKSNNGTTSLHFPSPNSSPTNGNGAAANIRGAKGTGTGEPGNIKFQFSTPVGSGTTYHSAYSDILTLSRLSIVGSVPITSTQFKLSALNTAPSSASDTGTLGEIRIVDGYIYICTATNTWKRVEITTWT